MGRSVTRRFADGSSISTSTGACLFAGGRKLSPSSSSEIRSITSFCVLVAVGVIPSREGPGVDTGPVLLTTRVDRVVSRRVHCGHFHALIPFPGLFFDRSRDVSSGSSNLGVQHSFRMSVGLVQHVGNRNR